MGFDLDEQPEKDSIKYVFLDEFERTSSQYQDALKAYIEEYSRKNVRFILTTNHINKVSDGIRSRFLEINFDCQNTEEERFLKTEIYKRIANSIAIQENFEVPKEILIKIINKGFPDFRSIMIDVDNYRLNGLEVIGNSNVDLKIRNELYNLIFDKDKDYEYCYHFLMNNFGPENIESMIQLLGKPFVEYCINERKSNIDKLFKANYIITDYSRLLENSSDPIILGLTILGKMRDLYQ
jgi:DNA polymerase III delta prime subunit